MSTVLVYPPACVRPLTATMASRLTRQLAADGIDLLVETGRVVHLTVLLPLTTRQEVHALRAVAEVTDARVMVHAERPPAVPECLLCKTTGGELEHELCGTCSGRLARRGEVA